MEVIDRLLSDFSLAKDNHDAMMSQITIWRDQIYIKPATGSDSSSAVPTGKYSSRMAMKDLLKVIESSTPSMVQPFITNGHIVKCTSKGNRDRSEIAESLLNQQWNQEIDTVELMNDIARVIQVDGSFILKLGWGNNTPTLDLVPFEEVFVDPNARSVKDINYVIQSRRIQMYEILNNPKWFGEYTFEELSKLVIDNPDDKFTANDGNGSDSNFNYEDGIRQYIDIYEYYGMMEVDGEVKPILAIFSGNELITLMDSPYPDRWRGLPFEFGAYSKRPFSIFGVSIAELIADFQSVRTGFMREILNNAQNANSNQKWNKKGALDIANKRKMLTGMDFETNTEPQIAIVQGQFNQVPQSVFNIMEQMKVEQEEITGIGRLNSGLDPRALNSGTSATAASLVQSNAERRLLIIVQSISIVIQRCMVKMLELNEIMLEPVSLSVLGQDMVVDKSFISSQVNVEVAVNTSGAKDSQNQNILMMVQQLQANAQVVPNAASLIQRLLAQLSDNLNLNGIAIELKKGMIEQSGQQEQQAQQAQIQQQEQQEAIEIQKAQAIADIDKTNADAALKQSQAIENQIEAQIKAYGV